jgi:lysophospholipase L1-like esterase
MIVLVFGDSIAQGYWDSEGGWVERLRKANDSATFLTWALRATVVMMC